MQNAPLRVGQPYSVEAGDPGVSIGIYAEVLLALELLDGLEQLADPAQDKVGQAFSSAELPKRVRMSGTGRKK